MLYFVPLKPENFSSFRLVSDPGYKFKSSQHFVHRIGSIKAVVKDIVHLMSSGRTKKNNIGVRQSDLNALLFLHISYSLRIVFMVFCQGLDLHILKKFHFYFYPKKIFLISPPANIATRKNKDIPLWSLNADSPLK